MAECFRRLLLASVIGLADPASAAVPTMGLVFSLGFTHVFTANMPFKSPDSNTLSIILSNSLTLIYIAALLIKMDTSSDSKQDQMIFTIFLLAILLLGPAAIAFQMIRSEFKATFQRLQNAMCGKVVVEEVISAEEAEKRYKKSLRKVKEASAVTGWLASGTDRKLVEFDSDSDSDSSKGTQDTKGGGAGSGTSACGGVIAENNDKSGKGSNIKSPTAPDTTAPPSPRTSTELAVSAMKASARKTAAPAKKQARAPAKRPKHGSPAAEVSTKNLSPLKTAETSAAEALHERMRRGRPQVEDI